MEANAHTAPLGIGATLLKLFFLKMEVRLL